MSCVIQSRSKHAPLAKRRTQTTLAYTESEANTRAALQLLTNQYCGGVLDLNDPADRTMTVLSWSIYLKFIV